MARDEDEGPYAPWNVSCILHQENCGQRKTNGTTARGEDHGRTKLTSNDVIKIFYSKKSGRQLAKEYKMGERAIYYIKCRKNWKHVTSKL